MIETDHTTSENWILYFRRNRENLMAIDWEDSYRLTDAEIHSIARSLQQFQLGESSEGNHLRHLADRYAALSGDSAFPEALSLFIQEEQRHSRDLGRFLQQQELPLAKKNWVDSLFRLLRHQASLELSVMAMLTAEIIAVPYYKALHDATHSPLLKEICRQLLRDEMQHLRFQIDTLSKLRYGRSPIAMAVTSLFQRTLFAGTLLVVWQQHRTVLKAGPYTFMKFWKTGWGRFVQLLGDRREMQPLHSI